MYGYTSFLNLGDKISTLKKCSFVKVQFLVSHHGSGHHRTVEYHCSDHITINTHGYTLMTTLHPHYHVSPQWVKNKGSLRIRVVIIRVVILKMWLVTYILLVTSTCYNVLLCVVTCCNSEVFHFWRMVRYYEKIPQVLPNTYDLQCINHISKKGWNIDVCLSAV